MVGELKLSPLEYLGLLFKADFMQGMLLAAICFLLPLKKRAGWKSRLFFLAVLSLAVNLAVFGLCYFFCAMRSIPCC